MSFAVSLGGGTFAGAQHTIFATRALCAAFAAMCRVGFGVYTAAGASSGSIYRAGKRAGSRRADFSFLAKLVA